MKRAVVKPDISFFIITVIVLFFTVYEVGNFRFSYSLEKELHYKTNKRIFDNLSYDHKQNVNILSAALALDPAVIEAYQKDDPSILKQHVLPIWNRLRHEKLVYEIHFFKPPAISFVNFSNFSSIGKDVSDVRKDIQWVTSSFKPSLHLMMCKTYAGIRATYPIIDTNGKMLGGLSMGKKIDWLPEILKNRTGDESFLIYTKESASSLSKHYYDEFMKDKQITGDYIFAEHTLPMNVSNLKDVNVTKPISTITIKGKEYTLFSYPIIDFNGKTMGYIFTLNDFDYYFDLVRKRFTSSLVIVLIISLLIYFIANRRLGRMIAQANSISRITRGIKLGEFGILGQKQNDLFTPREVLTHIRSEVIDLGKTIEKRYIDLEAKLLNQLFIDDLTSLPNRNAIMRDLVEEHDSIFVLINIRSFKQINDVFGFETGNEVLRNLALMLQDYANDIKYHFYRIGSDEFGLIVDKGDLEEEQIIAKVIAIIHMVNSTPIHTKNGFEITISIYAGICLEQSDMLIKADMALTEAKEKLLDFSIYTEQSDTKQKHKRNIEMIEIIKEALEDDRIVTHYQPIASVQSHRIHKYESLVRIEHQGMLIYPGAFLEVAKQTHFYHQISQKMIEQTLNTFRNRDEMFSINIDALDIYDDLTTEFLIDALSEFAETGRVVIEFTESNELYNSATLDTFVERIRKAGAKIAIDDFGVGYSNFTYIMLLRPDYLKIDGSLIRNLDTDTQAVNIVRTIVHFAKELGIRTVAEFVDRKEVMDICEELHIDELQGYYIGKPAPAPLPSDKLELKDN